MISNIIMTVQSLVMRKIYDPEKMKAQVAAEIAARRRKSAAASRATHDPGQGRKDRQS